MKKQFLLVATSLGILGTAACGASEDTSDVSENADSTDTSNDTEESTESDYNPEEETITFGLTTWTSTEAPTEIARLILEEAGYNVEFSTLDQPIIFEGLENEDVDFFMDAWLPYTEEELWNQYEDSLTKVTASYEEVPLGWVVPSYVDIDSVEDLHGEGEKFDNEIVSIDPGAGIVSITEAAVEDYDLADEYDISTSSEVAMIGELDNKINQEEPVIITGWRPHSMFANYDLKFLEEPNENFKPDNVYVISYDSIEEKHPRAYEILSDWSIEVGDLEEMMLTYEEDEIPFDELAEEWIEENRDQVDEMLAQ
ncbi:glycine betaine ABC transporter substrate-binding protein [Texcoconibacillus texcoconensis]|uniref:Glycine betaine/proline transport system substrate-binding protein n=1 Tax=Texcoconibacillus texcoconensis TaxID=1095777 RepID=A0A840QMM6_9BACI|nr:glycine betaine ABC transporter substrate-binding protein [Texcoconibacillus texcoconensis]MBB5172634.1 glycine betaine/proline transport system substrate-binding protein [Texcoconibacillus texcoconensis]